MKRIFRRFQITNKGLRYKLILAFSLMSVIPLLACTYLISTYIFPKAENMVHVSMVILAAIFIAILGLISARRFVDPVVDMAIEANIIANGEYDRKIAVESDDEVGNLGASINIMTQRIKTNLDELKNYGQRMREINVEVHKKVLALSSLLQIGDIISAGSVNLDSLLELAVEKAGMIFDSGFGVLYLAKNGSDDLLVKTSYNIDKELLESIVIKCDGKGFLEDILHSRSVTVVDKTTRPSKETQYFMEEHNLKNMLAMPLYTGKKDFGMLIVGTKTGDFKFKNDDIDLVKVFAKQIAIAVESDMLSKKTEELAIKDELTDLYNKNFIETRLEDEIKRAIFYQRPCSFIVINIDNFKAFREMHGEIAAEEMIKKMAKLVKDSAAPIAKVARVNVDEFAMLLPEKNKKEATLLAEELRKKVEESNLVKDIKATLRVSVGVSENPIDGATSDEILKKASENLRQAKLQGKNRVVA